MSLKPQAESNPRAVDWAHTLANHGRWLRTVIHARVGDSHAVDEVMQEVSCAALRCNGQFPAGAGVTTWLYRVAVRQSLLYRRKTGRRERHIERETLDAAAARDRAPDPLNWLLAAEEAQLVQAAMKRLRPTDRQLLLLKYTEDWTCRQIAGSLGVSESTIQTRLLRARRRLRDELARLDMTGKTDDGQVH